MDPYLEQLKIVCTALSYAQTKDISNHNFAGAVYNQVLATQSQCGVFVFGDHCHSKALSDDGNHNLKDHFPFDQTNKNKYNKAAQELVVSSLIINNSLSSKTWSYLRGQYVVNQSNYPDTVVKAVTTITSF